MYEGFDMTHKCMAVVSLHENRTFLSANL